MTTDVSSSTGDGAASRPADPDWQQRVRASFERQGLMAHLGAALVELQPGRVAIALPWRPELTQQHGYFHAGATSAIADSAGGYAGYTLFPAASEVLTVEFKVNLTAPAQGERLVAIGEVIRAGRTLTVCDLKVHAETEGRRTLVASGQQTLIRLDPRA